MAKETSRRQLAHQAKLKAAGIKRVSVWLPLDVQAALDGTCAETGASQHSAIVSALRSGFGLANA